MYLVLYTTPSLTNNHNLKLGFQFHWTGEYTSEPLARCTFTPRAALRLTLPHEHSRRYVRLLQSSAILY
jgi:hypothetical protein